MQSDQADMAPAENALAMAEAGYHTNVSLEQADALFQSHDRLKAALLMLIDNVETGSYESTGQAIDLARREIAAAQ